MQQVKEAIVLNPKIFSGKFTGENKTQQLVWPQETSAFKKGDFYESYILLTTLCLIRLPL